MEGLTAVKLDLLTKVGSIFISPIFTRDVDNVSRKLVGRTSFGGKRGHKNFHGLKAIAPIFLQHFTKL